MRRGGQKAFADNAEKSIHGCFTSRGLADRPFILDVEKASSGRSFATYAVTVRQPRTPSATTTTTFAPSDAEKDLGPTCFTGLVALKSPEPHAPPLTTQRAPPQETHAAILASRSPTSWPPSPSVDIDWIVSLFPDAGPGTFPAVDVRQVDMAAYNAARPPHERKELLLYRLLAPLPASAPPSAHVLAHAFVADRNGLLMLCKQFWPGAGVRAVATLSWSFYVHVDAAEAVLEGEGWWVLENSFERAAAGRGFMVGRVFSPGGLHVATAVQDGLAQVAGVSEKL